MLAVEDDEQALHQELVVEVRRHFFVSLLQDSEPVANHVQRIVNCNRIVNLCFVEQHSHHVVQDVLVLEHRVRGLLDGIGIGVIVMVLDLQKEVSHKH